MIPRKTIIQIQPPTPPTRPGHTAPHCYAKTYVEEEVWCCDNCDREFDTQKGAAYHQRFHCREKKKKSSKCRRCGRNNHYTNNCYAETHVRGYDLDDGY